MPAAVITGASHGLGHALAVALADRHWSLVVDARHGEDLSRAAVDLDWRGTGRVVALAGDVSDRAHQAALVDAVSSLGSGLDLLVNNASVLGPSPQPSLSDYPLDALAKVYDVNVVAPLAMTQRLLPALRVSGGVVMNITSDAAVEPYAGWGGYGSSKAALDQLTAILAAEEPGLAVYAVDPGDMRTRLHQEAFPGEDISDRPLPESVVPALLRLVGERPPSGRYRAAELHRDAVEVA